MPTKVIVIVGLLLAGVLGLGPTYARFQWFWHPPKFRWDEPIVSVEPGKRYPKAVVAEKEFDLGLVERDSHADHSFVFTNVGEAPLTLTALGVECRKCTEILPIDQPNVKPGESGAVTVRYRAIVDGEFHKWATIGTNDPAHPQITVTVKGKSVSSHEFHPPRLIFAGVTTHESRQDTVDLISYLADKIEISKWEITEPSLAGNFDVTWKPMTAEELQGNQAKSGAHIVLASKPGLPQGVLPPLSLKLTTNLQPNPVVELLIEGSVVGDISIIGKEFRPDPDRVEWGFLDSHKENAITLQLFARGGTSEPVTYEVTLVEPSFLHAEIGKTSGKMTALQLNIPKGTPICNYLGGGENPIGHIELKTSHPFVPRIRLPIMFAVSQ
jgi:hypothetical protein